MIPFFPANMAKSVVIGKIANCRTVLQRALRDHGEKIAGPAMSKKFRCPFISAFWKRFRKQSHWIRFGDMKGMQPMPIFLSSII